MLKKLPDQVVFLTTEFQLKMDNKNKLQKFESKNNKLVYQQIERQLADILEGQEINQNELRLGFIGLAKQNQELLELTKQQAQ